MCMLWESIHCMLVIALRTPAGACSFQSLRPNFELRHDFELYFIFTYIYASIILLRLYIGHRISWREHKCLLIKKEDAFINEKFNNFNAYCGFAADRGIFFALYGYASASNLQNTFLGLEWSISTINQSASGQTQALKLCVSLSWPESYLIKMAALVVKIRTPSQLIHSLLTQKSGEFLTRTKNPPHQRQRRAYLPERNAALWTRHAAYTQRLFVYVATAVSLAHCNIGQVVKSPPPIDLYLDAPLSQRIHHIVQCSFLCNTLNTDHAPSK